MSRPAVFAEQFPDSWVGAALDEHREERDTLLASLTSSLRNDPRVLAAWLWGSFGKGEADDLSDLDPWIVVTDAAIGEMGAALRLYAEQTGNFITGGESSRNAPPQGGFFNSLHEGRHGLLHVDCYWQALSAVAEIPEKAALFNHLPLREPATAPFSLPTPRASAKLTEEEERIEDGIGFSWLMLSIAAKTLARYPDSDMSLALYSKPGFEEAAALLGLEEVAQSADWSVPERPSGKVERLRQLAGKTEQLTQTAIGRGLELSPRNAVCLTRYLDMVEGILS